MNRCRILDRVVGLSAAPEVAEGRAKSNGEDHIGPPYCKRILTVEGINADSVGPRDHVFFFQKPLCRYGNDRSALRIRARFSDRVSCNNSSQMSTHSASSVGIAALKHDSVSDEDFKSVWKLPSTPLSSTCFTLIAASLKAMLVSENVLMCWHAFTIS